MGIKKSLDELKAAVGVVNEGVVSDVITAELGEGGDIAAAIAAALAAKTAAVQANSTATDVAGLVTDFNALLAKLKAVGLMASE